MRVFMNQYKGNYDQKCGIAVQFFSKIITVRMPSERFSQKKQQKLLQKMWASCVNSYSLS